MNGTTSGDQLQPKVSIGGDLVPSSTQSKPEVCGPAGGGDQPAQLDSVESMTAPRIQIIQGSECAYKPAVTVGEQAIARESVADPADPGQLSGSSSASTASEVPNTPARDTNATTLTLSLRSAALGEASEASTDPAHRNDAAGPEDASNGPASDPPTDQDPSIEDLLASTWASAASGAGADDHVPPVSRYSGASAGAAERIITTSGAADAGAALRELAVGKEKNDDEDESSNSQGRQPAFEAAKHTVALWPHEQKDRKRRLDRIGVLFRQDVRKALEGFPEVEMLWRLRDRLLDPVGFTDEDKAKIEEALGLKFIDAGGMAGGIKAVHEGLGLFLKFAFDHLGIYGSTRMAAKAAKREAAASRWVHAMDSVHVSTPLLECVDVRVDVSGGGWYVIRVQAFARVDVQGCMAWDQAAFRTSYREQHDGREPDAGAFEAAFDVSVRETTLRVGSSDGGISMHQDDEQLEDVVKPLARHFRVAEYECANVATLVRHVYVPTTSGTGALDAAAAGAGSLSTRTFLDVLQDRGMDPAKVQRLRAALDPARMRLTEEDEKKLTLQEQELARAVYAAIKSTGANLDYRKPLPDVEHVCKPVHGRKVNMRLPFDVEVHQLASGQRVVLDTHRLLIPDVVWMDWMESDEAKPRVWATKNVKCGPTTEPTMYHSQLGSWCAATDGQIVSLESVSAALQCWCDSTDGLTGIRFQPNDMQRHMDTGCVSASAKDSSGQVNMVAIVSCPRWYYSGSASMTCLLPPEAAHRLRELLGEDAFEGLSPDLIMEGDAGAKSRARECIGKLYEKARAEVEDRYRDELALEVCRTVDVDVQANCEVHRGVLKRVMHSFGLGLRHVGLLVDQLLQQRERLQVQQAVSIPSLRSTNMLPWLRAATIIGVEQSTMRCAVAAFVYGRAMVCNSGAFLDGAALHACLAPPERTTTPTAHCVGTDLASEGGMYNREPLRAVISLVQGIAHTQRVGGSELQRVLGALRKFCSRSSGLHTVSVACAARQLKPSCGVKITSIPFNERNSGMECWSRIADYLRSDCQYSEAMDLYEHCRQVQETTLGKQHPSYGATLRTMAECLFEQGHPSKAISILSKCKEIEETSIGKQHPDYASTLNGIAACLSTQGQYARAMQLYVQSKQIYETLQDKQHPDYATTLCNMAGCLKSQGQYKKAIELYEQSSKIQETVLGKQHPDHAETLGSMAGCLQSMGQYSEAMELYEQCRQILASALGKQHRYYAAILCSKSLCLHDQGHYNDAMELYEQCRQIQETTIGKRHLDYATTLGNMGQCLSSQGRDEDAMSLIEQSRQIKEVAVGTQHPSYVATLNNMAACLESQGQYSEAMELYEQCRQIREASLGKQHRDYAVTLNNLAECLQKQGKISEALQYFEQCRLIYEAALGTHHPEYAAAMHNEAECLVSRRRYAEAMQLFNRSRQILEAALGRQHAYIAAVLNGMARCLYLQGKLEEALRCFEDCRGISAISMGKSHPKYLMILSSMQTVCRSSDTPICCTIDVLIHLEEALALQKGKQSQEYRDTVQELVGLLVDEGRMKEAQRYMTETGGAIKGSDSTSPSVRRQNAGTRDNRL